MCRNLDIDIDIYNVSAQMDILAGPVPAVQNLTGRMDPGMNTHI